MERTEVPKNGVYSFCGYVEPRFSSRLRSSFLGLVQSMPNVGAVVGYIPLVFSVD